jgi:hypothetical protein
VEEDRQGHLEPQVTVVLKELQEVEGRRDLLVLLEQGVHKDPEELLEIPVQLDP